MKTLNIELLALDLAVCDRCGGTLANLREALKAVRPSLAALGIEAALKETLIESEEQAERLRFVSSPTIRIAGQDITGAVRETACGACTDLSGSEKDIECRVWPWRSQTYDAAPTGQIVEAILRAALAPEAAPHTAPWKGVPANIQTFLRAKAQKAACCERKAEPCCDRKAEACCDRKAEACCDTTQSETCCEPACCQ